MESCKLKYPICHSQNQMDNSYGSYRHDSTGHMHSVGGVVIKCHEGLSMVVSLELL